MADARSLPAGAGWALFAVLLAAGALLGGLAPRDALDWQPARIGEAWRWWTAAFVHLSPRHLGANLIGCAVVGAFGWRARLTARAVAAWAAAWPLTHLGLLAAPALAHYGGLSGVLHAGVAVAALMLAVRRAGADRWIALAVLAGLAAKIALEAPWRGPLQQVAGWDFAVAPLAHATGAAAGLACAAIARSMDRR